MGSKTYAANLQNVGLARAETEALLGSYAQSGDWAKVRDLALGQNLLGKRSTITVRHILKVVARRYLRGPEWLPDGQSAGRFFAHPSVPLRAKTEVAFLYTVAEDPLVQCCHEQLVLSAAPDKLDAYLHTERVVTFLEELATKHPELARWKPYLRVRWSQGFLSLLRDVGFVEPVPSWRLSRPVVLAEAFGFVFPWLAAAMGSPRAAFPHRCLRWWGLDAAETRRLLGAGQERGWWGYASSGSVVEFKPSRRPGEVLSGALG
jgi:hypothetical protein